SPFSPLASARAVLASSSINRALTSDTVKLRPHRAKDRDSEENFRSARPAVFVTFAEMMVRRAKRTSGNLADFCMPTSYFTTNDHGIPCCGYCGFLDRR